MGRFALYLPAYASPERVKAHHRYVAAVEAMMGFPTPAAFERMRVEHDEAKRLYGVALLAEHKARSALTAPDSSTSQTGDA